MFVRNKVSWTSLMVRYLNFGDVDAARWVFDEMPVRNESTWNAIIKGLVKLNDMENARKSFDAMPARFLFDEIPQKDSVSWLALISGFVQNGKPDEAVQGFNEMQAMNLQPDEFIMVSLMSACSQLGSLELANWIESYLREGFFDLKRALVTAAVVDMNATIATAETGSCFLQFSEKLGMILINNFLNGKNFLTWKCSMIIALKAKTKTDFDDWKEKDSMNFLAWKQSVVIALEVESLFGFVDEIGLKPETITEEYFKLKWIDSIIFAWIKSPNDGKEICDGHDYMAFEIFGCGIKSYQNALWINSRHYYAWNGIRMIYLRQDKFEYPRLDCGFNGYGAPIIPRTHRSIRRNSPYKKLVEGSELCAFEFLAAVNYIKLYDEMFGKNATENEQISGDEDWAPTKRSRKGKEADAASTLMTLGFNAAFTEPIDIPGRRGDQIKEMELKLHPELRDPLTLLCNDPNTTLVVLSGSDIRVLDDNFREYNMWLAAENGMFLRSTKGDWMTTMPEHLNMDWVDSVRHVLEYFTERTPRSHFEIRKTSLVWNYKYADVEFGRLQARDMLQHLWTGPISNSSVDVVQGSRSVEVRAVGVTKGAAIDRILGEIVHSKAISMPIDYVLCVGHFLGKDEDVYTFFEPELPLDSSGLPRSKVTDAIKHSVEKRQPPKLPSCRSNSRPQGKSQQNGPSSDKKSAASNSGSSNKRSVSQNISWNVLDLKKENYFSVAVGRTRTNARYLLNNSDDVVSFLKELTEATFSSSY